MPSRPVVFQRWPPSRYRNSRVVYGRALERRRELGDPVVVADELFFAGVGVVDAIDAIVRQRGIVGVRRADVVMLPARLVEIVIEVRAGRDQAVDVAVRRSGARRPGAARRRSARPPCPRKIVHVVLEHLLPDATRGREIASLERDPLHPRQHFVRAQAGARPRTARQAHAESVIWGPCGFVFYFRRAVPIAAKQGGAALARRMDRDATTHHR